MAKYYGRCLSTFKMPDGHRRKCTGRRMLTKLPGDYLRPPKCPHCGGTRWYLDTNIVRRHKKERCYCGGLHYVHRIGTRYCYHHPEAEKDHAERYAKSC